MKNKLKVKTFAEIVGIEEYLGRITFIRHKHLDGYSCTIANYYSLHTYDIWVPAKNLIPLSENKKQRILQYLEGVNKEKEFYEKALLQIEKEK